MYHWPASVLQYPHRQEARLVFAGLASETDLPHSLLQVITYSEYLPSISKWPFEPRFHYYECTITAALTEIERARGFLEAATLTDEWVDAMRSRAFLLEAHHTTHIEGTRLTLWRTPTILLAGRARAGSGPGRRPRTSQLP